ncbi:MAG: hypothetical protein WCI77_08025 [Candidatus Omnitrophota bacterium]
MDKELFRANIAKGIEKGKLGIDRDAVHDRGKGIIFGYAVVTKGKLNDGDIRDWELDEKSLDQVIELSSNAEIGVKSRFGHPNMSSEALGTFLGRGKNFRKDGDIVRADLYIDNTAYNTPQGDLATYIMDLAESDPQAFGSSLVFHAEFEKRLNEDGTPKKDELGKELPDLVRFKKIFASDIVESPATTKGLFGTFFTDSVKPSAEMTAFLDRFLNSPTAVDKLISFLSRYQINGEKEIKTKKEVVQMELKEITLEVFRTGRPDLLNEILSQERSRVVSILEKSASYGDGMFDIAKEAISKGEGLEVTEEKFKAKKLELLQKAAPVTPGPGDPESGSENVSDVEKFAKEYESSKELQMEFSSKESYVSFKQAEKSGKVNIFKKQ